MATEMDKEEPEDSKTMTPQQRKLVDYVVYHTDKWRTNRDTNYQKDWEQYERLWGGIWSPTEKMRESERSRVVSPVLQSAVENYQAEIDEAIFGRTGEFFDVEDDVRKPNPEEVQAIRKLLREEFKKNRLRQSVSEVILNMAVYGTGIAELILKNEKRRTPDTEETALPGVNAVGVREQDYFCVKVHPVHPRNFLIDPASRTAHDGLGCAVEEYVPAFSVYEMMENESYMERDLGKDNPEVGLETWQQDENNDADRILVLRWYGKVPKALIDPEYKDEDAEEDLMNQDNDGGFAWSYDDMVEAVIVIGNGSELLKAEENVNMMGDRPIVTMQADIRPGRFWGRGICEKGAPMQKVIDGQLRAHLDFSALTAVPMIGIDSTTLPKGFKFEVKPGRSIFTNGNPNDSLMPLKIGDTSPLNVQTAELFERFLLMATNTMDSKNIPSVNSDDGGNALAAIIKKNKRTLTSFQDDFLIPLVEKTAWRYMQFDPERFPVKDYTFIPISTLGVVARNYEMQQYISMLSTLGPQSPVVPILLTGVLESSSLSNREELIAAMQKMVQPDPAEQQMQQQKQMLEMEGAKQQVVELMVKNQKTQAETRQIEVETELYPREVEGRMIAALTKNSEEAPEFAQRVAIAELALKEAELNEKGKDRESNERISQIQAMAAAHSKQAEIDHKAQATQKDQEEREKDRELKRQELQARKAEKQLIRDKNGNLSGVRTKE